MMKLLAKIWRILSLSKATQLSAMCFSEDQFLIGVTGVVFNDKDEILLCKHTYRQIEWSLPGGYLKATEHPKEGLEREIADETGFIVSIDDQLKLRTDSETARLDIALIGTYIGGTFKPTVEVSEAEFFSFGNLPQISLSQLLLIQEALKYKKSLQKVTTLKEEIKTNNRLMIFFRQLGQWLP